MSKTKLIVTAILSIGLLFGLGISFYLIYAPPKNIGPASASGGFYNPRGRQSVGDNLPLNENSVGDITYKDESGFSFMHPVDVQIIDITPEDNIYYTLLSLKKGTGRMTVSIKDTNYKSLKTWYEVEGQARSLVGTVVLGDIKANQYADGSSLLTVAVDGGVLYVIQSPRDTTLWDGVHDTFVSSFTFDFPETLPVQVSNSTQSGGVIYEEEEVIE